MDFTKVFKKLYESSSISRAEDLFRRNGIKINKIIESKTTKKNDPYDAVLEYLTRNDDEWKKFKTKYENQFIYKNTKDKSEIFLNIRGPDGLGFFTV